MKINKIYFTLVLLFLSGSGLFAQDFVRGVVITESQKGKFEPVAYATAQWLDFPVGAVCDSSGTFKIAYRPEYKRLLISFVGYKSDTLEVTEENRNQIRIILRNDNMTLTEVEVTAERAGTFVDYLNPIKTQVMNEKELFKAACCNLSESFETNPSVDVSFSDAVTGVKQVQMLGLAGAYTQITTENLPGIRGLAGNFGLGFIPGTWIESIQVTKGIGSVANGYESISGQINVELRKPYNSDDLFLNLYQSSYGRSEVNLNLSKVFGKSRRWGTVLMAHYDRTVFQPDMNDDGFADLPSGNQINLVNRWHYENYEGFSAQFGLKYTEDNRLGGQISFDPAKDKLGNLHYGAGFDSRRTELFGKSGYVFKQQKYKSLGLMMSYTDYRQDSYFGQNKYDGQNRTFYSNLIYQSIIGTTTHKFRTGLSLLSDSYDETFQQKNYARDEKTAGVFYEYTYSPSEAFSAVLGIRADLHNLFGFFVSPRLHLRYQISPDLSVRAAFGRGQRAANIFTENTSVFVSSRQIAIEGENPSNKAYGLNPEVAWNSGLSMRYEFMLAGKAGSLDVDLHRTDFSNQVVVDRDRSARTVAFYNLKGNSFSNSIQTEINYELMKKLDLRLAYRFFDVQSNYDGRQTAVPFISRHRFFANAGYSLGAWKFDLTANLNGPKRLPGTSENPEPYRRDDYSPSFTVWNAQISYSPSKTLDLYLGGENLSDYRQKDLITAADQPFGDYFDASMVWGPVMGRMIYGGLRFRLGKK